MQRIVSSLKPCRSRPDLVVAAHLRGIAVGDHEGRHILHDLRAAAGQRVPSDPAELMHRGEPADDRVIPHFDMAGERAVVGEDHVVADDAVVRDVAVGEEISAAADARDRAGRGAAMHGDEFAESVLVADLEIRRLARVFQILRLLPDAS